MDELPSFRDCFLLFPQEPDIWDSLDIATQEKVVDCLATLLLQHFQQAAHGPEAGQPLAKERKP